MLILLFRPHQLALKCVFELKLVKWVQSYILILFLLVNLRLSWREAHFEAELLDPRVVASCHEVILCRLSGKNCGLTDLAYTAPTARALVTLGDSLL